MLNLTRDVWLLRVPQGIFDLTVLHNLYPDITPGARRAMVHRAIRAGEVHRIRRGIYYLDSRFIRQRPHPYLVAGRLQFPSYISFESALRFHGWIPEAVYQVASVIPNRSRTLKTSLGVFSYQRVPAGFFKAGVRAEKILDRYWIFMASPFRAIADRVYVRKSVTWKGEGMGFLHHSLRIPEHRLKEADPRPLEEVIRNMTNRRTREYMTRLKEVVVP